MDIPDAMYSTAIRSRLRKNVEYIDTCAFLRDCRIADPTSIIPMHTMIGAYILSTWTNSGRSSAIDGEYVNGSIR